MTVKLISLLVSVVSFVGYIYFFKFLSSDEAKDERGKYIILKSLVPFASLIFAGMLITSFLDLFDVVSVEWLYQIRHWTDMLSFVVLGIAIYKFRKSV